MDVIKPHLILSRPDRTGAVRAQADRTVDKLFFYVLWNFSATPRTLTGIGMTGLFATRVEVV
jgi:hypothetical protein